jgi:hypothetical protein
MPLYLFAMNEDVPLPESGEHLRDDRAACKWAAQISREMNRNRERQANPIRVKAYRKDGSPVDSLAEQSIKVLSLWPLERKSN